jgi:hypothetical protein
MTSMPNRPSGSTNAASVGPDCRVALMTSRVDDVLHPPVAIFMGSLRAPFTS